MNSRTLFRTVVAAVVLAGAGTASATTIVTGRLTPERDGWLACTATNLSMKLMDMRIEIRNARGRIVTDYILTERNDEGVLARVFAESRADDAAYCRLQVQDAWRRDVGVVLESFDQHGNVLERTGPQR